MTSTDTRTTTSLLAPFMSTQGMEKSRTSCYPLCLFMSPLMSPSSLPSTVFMDLNPLVYPSLRHRESFLNYSPRRTRTSTLDFTLTSVSPGPSPVPITFLRPRSLSSDGSSSVFIESFPHPNTHTHVRTHTRRHVRVGVYRIGKHKVTVSVPSRTILRHLLRSLYLTSRTSRIFRCTSSNLK